MTRQREALKKGIKLRSLFSLSFGTIIGVGWITVMGSWLSGAGSMGALIAFLGGGLAMLVVGLCYAEMATMYPVSGGEVAYVLEAWGPRWSFAAAWFLAFNYIFATSFEAISVEWIMSALVPGFGGPIIYSIFGQAVRLWSLVLGLAIMAIISVINYRGGKTAAWFQEIMTAGLVLASVIFIAVGLFAGDVANLKPAFVGNTPGAVLIGVLGVLATTPFWFAGFDTIPQAMGEVEEGTKLDLLPRVIAMSIVFAIVFYVLVILAASMSLPRPELLGMELPAAAAMEAAFGSPVLGKVVLFAGLCGLITTWNALFFASTRIVFSLGRGYMIPHRFARVHDRFGSPATAVIFVGIMGGLGALFGRKAILVIVSASASTAALVFALVVIGVMRLRSTRRDHARPYKVPGGKLLLYVGIVLSVGLLAVSVYEQFHSADGRVPTEWMVILAWTLLGGLFYLAASPMRREVSEEERRWLILNEDDG